MSDTDPDLSGSDDSWQSYVQAKAAYKAGKEALQPENEKDPGVLQLRRALQEDVTTGLSGVCPLPDGKTILYYGKDSDARRIDLSKATSPELEHLSRTCDAATFGRGQEDVLDESYRKAGKLDLEHFSSTFELSESKIMDVVRPFVLQDKDESFNTVRSELYKLNVYEKGAFFRTHKDTPRADNMIASLVIVFATPHEGGTLVLRHDDKEWVYDSAGSLSSLTGPHVGYIVFFSDVEHEVLPVTSGYRVTLTYNIYLDQELEEPLAVPRGPAFQWPTNVNDSFSAILADPSFLPDGGLIGFGLRHQYPFRERFDGSDKREHKRAALQRVLNILKGGDRAIYSLCKQLGLDAYLRVIYRSDAGQVVMSDHVAEGGEENECWHFVKDELVDKNGGVWIQHGGQHIYYDEEPEEHPVRWITEMTTFNKVKLAYMAYGNHAELNHLYGDFSLICSVGPAGNRKTSA